MRQLLMIATLMFTLGCSDGPPPPGAQRWESSELVGYTYMLVSEELDNRFWFDERGVSATLGRKGGAMTGPEWSWTIDEKGILNFGHDAKSPDFRWAKIKVEGDLVTIASSNSAWRESKYRKTKSPLGENTTK